MNGEDDGGGGLALPGLRVGVEEYGGEDPYIFGVEDRLSKAGEEFIWVLREECNGEGMNGELGFIGGEAEGQPGRLAHWEGFVKLGGEGVEVGCKSGSGGGRVDDEESDRSAVVDLGRDCEGEGTARIPKDTGSDVGEGGCDQGRL